MVSGGEDRRSGLERSGGRELDSILCSHEEQLWVYQLPGCPQEAEIGHHQVPVLAHSGGQSSHPLSGEIVNYIMLFHDSILRTKIAAPRKVRPAYPDQMEEEVVINLKNKSKLMMDNVDYERVEQMVYALFSVV